MDHKDMRTSLSHLPAEKQQELEQIAGLIDKAVQPELVILYGSYARGDYKEEKDLAPHRWSGHASDYDILVVVSDRTAESDAELGRQLYELCNAQHFSASVRPIVHRLSHVNQSLREGRYFFLDIKREGRVLLGSNIGPLTEPEELPTKDRLRIAQEYFQSCFPQAAHFYEQYEFSLAKEQLRPAAFNLNQTTESAYKCILLVHTLYCPHEHLLDYLGFQASDYGPVFEEIFPHTTQLERDMFQLLDNAYIAARYHLDFNVTEEDLDYLAPKVQRLLDVTQALCEQELERLREESQE
ncbi:HEPN domain-containing protein [Alkalilimnicola ehrlichii]|uniref:HEPN domain-containing protein n=1 Tax=Alkalilimnicola ehrlichii TaxID=351052 RepID=UPI0015F2596F|nr:HEPN domain-containing protein [Alkalilimnicola ehrlichii]